MRSVKVQQKQTRGTKTGYDRRKQKKSERKKRREEWTVEKRRIELKWEEWRRVKSFYPIVLPFRSHISTYIS